MLEISCPSRKWQMMRCRTILVTILLPRAIEAMVEMMTIIVMFPASWEVLRQDLFQSYWQKLGVTKMIQRDGSWVRNWMVCVVFGLALPCTQEMEIDSTSLNFSQKDGQKVNWMANFLLIVVNSPKHYRQSVKMCQSTINGKMSDI